MKTIVPNACKGAEFIQTVSFISTDTYDRVSISVTYFQFQIPLLVCFCTVVEVK